MHQDSPWTVIQINEPFTCPFFTVRADIVAHSGGSPRPYASIRTKLYGVAALPIDEKGFVTLVGQYRYVLDRFTWELPGGGARYDRAALDCAQQELSEETGYKAAHWAKIVDTCIAPGTSDEIAIGFVAWGLQHGDPHPDPEERLSVKSVAFNELVSMALTGEISHICSVATILSLQVRLSRGGLPDDLARLLLLQGK